MRETRIRRARALANARPTTRDSYTPLSGMVIALDSRLLAVRGVEAPSECLRHLGATVIFTTVAEARDADAAVVLPRAGLGRRFRGIRFTVRDLWDLARVPAFMAHALTSARAAA